MQGVPLRTGASRCLAWITCALLLFAPWLLHHALTQTPIAGTPIAVRLSFHSEEVPEIGPELEAPEAPVLSLESESEGPVLLPPVTATPPKVKLAFSPVPAMVEPERRAEPPAPLPPVTAAPIEPVAQRLYFVKEVGSVGGTWAQDVVEASSQPPERVGHATIKSVNALPEAMPVTSPSPATSPVAPPSSVPVPNTVPIAPMTPTAVVAPAVTLPPTPGATPDPALVHASAVTSPGPSDQASVQLFFAEGMPAGAAVPLVDPSIVPVACSGCGSPGGGVLNPYYSGNHIGMPGGCRGCGGGGGCNLRRPCSPCLANTQLGRFLCCVYECICCPDPCYDPRWIPVADAAFFVDAPRPQTQTRFRFDVANNLLFPDRNTYFWAQANGVSTSGPPGTGPFPTPPLRGEKRVDYYELSMYTEVATGLIGFFFEMPYRSLYPEIANSAAGFGDINMGTKSLLYDCELFQLTFMFRTYILSGNFAKGLGNGHVTIEPTLILGVRLGPETYSVLEVGEWIPFAPPSYGAPVLRANYCLSQVLYRVLPDVPLIGTLEMQTWSFQGGNYTDPVLGTQRSTGVTYVNVGPGLRTVICDKLDFGVGTSFALTAAHWAQQLIRMELRLRF